jgi:hypothetical protein
VFLAGVVLLAACLTGIMKGIADDAEERRLKRREKYRRIAYADVYRRRVKNSNREALWSEVNR